MGKQLEAAIDTMPPGSNVTPLADVPFEMPERVFFQQLDERTRRVELMTAHLAAGGMPPESAVLALQAALGAIVGSASDAKLRSLAELATALRSAIGHLGIGAPSVDERGIVDTLVFDEAELSRDLVALSVEAHGHTVRCASTYDSFIEELGKRKPGLLIVEIELSNAPASSFCATLKELVAAENIPVVFFSMLEGEALAQLTRTFGACRGISKACGIDVLIGELRAVYQLIVEIRANGIRPVPTLRSGP